MAPSSTYDATAIHKKGAQTMEGPLKVAGPTSYVEFPDGSKQYVAGGGGPGGSAGFLLIYDVGAQGGGAISAQTYLDPPQNTVLTSCTSSTADIVVYLRSSHPNVKIGSTTATLPRFGDIYQGSVNVTVAAGVVTCEVNGMTISTTFTIALDLPPSLVALSFSGGYPGSQTELKAGDTYQITGTTDKDGTGIFVENTGAGTGQTIVVAITAGVPFNATITIADRGTTLQALAANVRVRNAAGAYGAYRATNFGGGTTDGVHLVNLNNLYPTLTFATPSYPVGQGALKDSESATVAITRANLDTITYSSPNGDLSITNPTLDEATKTVTRIAGNYNVATTNFRGAATRAANAATTTTNGIVRIAHTFAAITVATPAARLRSGGNNGTSAQNHTITINSDQILYEAPSMDKSEAETTWVGSWTLGGGATSATRTLQVHDDDTKGSYVFNSLSAKNLAGKVTTTITSGSAYVLGGFVARTLTFAAYSQTTPLNVAVITYTKLTAGIFSASGNPALRNPNPYNHDDIVDTYTVDALATNPTTIWWNDVFRAGSNTGTAVITNVEETV